MSEAAKKHYDPLLDCLVIFARLFHRAVPVEALIAGLPTAPNASGPEMFSLDNSKGMFARVAERAGFASRLIRRDLDKLSRLLLPCILVLHHGNACILETIDWENDKAKIILPDLGEGEQWIELSELNAQYLGYAFLLKRLHQTEQSDQRLLDVKKGHWFWTTLRRSREIYASVILGSLMINLFVLVTPIFTMNVYDRVVPNSAVETLWFLATGVAVVYCFDTTFRFIRNYLLEVAGKKSDVIMSSQVFERVLNFRMDHWPKSVGAFSSVLGQFESIRNFFTASTIVTFVDLPFSFLFLAVIAYIGDALVSIPLITMALLMLYGMVVARPLRGSIMEVFAASANKNSILVESLHSIQTIKILGIAGHAQWAWEETTGEIAAKSLRARLWTGSIGVVTHILMQLNTVAIVIAGVYMIKELELTLGALIAVVLLSSRAIAPMVQVASLITNYQQTKAAFASMEKLMNTEVERPENKNYVRRTNLEGNIRFQNVEFAYPDAERAALSNFTLAVSPGEHVGIIGRVGSGKTTIAKLLLGLYAPGDGALSIDNIDINQIDPADLRRNLAFMTQDTELMRGTIRENIILKNPKADDEAVLDAAHIAGVDLFVNSMPKGFDTPVGEQGYALSSGQRQCIALARTVLPGERVIILDEPSNSMDNTTESIIRKRLYDYTRSKTLLLVTHKAPMLELVERLVVVEDGRTIMDGPKEIVLAALQERSNAA